MPILGTPAQNLAWEHVAAGWWVPRCWVRDGVGGHLAVGGSCCRVVVAGMGFGHPGGPGWVVAGAEPCRLRSVGCGWVVGCSLLGAGWGRRSPCGGWFVLPRCGCGDGFRSPGR